MCWQARFSRGFRLLCAGPVVAVALIAPPAVWADPVGREAPARVYRITQDSGGSIAARVRHVARLRAQGARVQIRGACWSSCTMYLALPDTCVSRRALLGFHGPGSVRPGIGLRPEAFEYWSQLIARHYPEPLRGWYLREGRYVTVGFTEFRGADLLRLGIAECPP